MEDDPVEKPSLPPTPPSGDIVLLLLFVLVAVIMFAVYLAQLPRDSKDETPSVLPTEVHSSMVIGSEVEINQAARSEGLFYFSCIREEGIRSLIPDPGIVRTKKRGWLNLASLFSYAPPSP